MKKFRRYGSKILDTTIQQNLGGRENARGMEEEHLDPNL